MERRVLIVCAFTDAVSTGACIVRQGGPIRNKRGGLHTGGSELLWPLWQHSSYSLYTSSPRLH